MYIRELELVGFKSFVTKTRLEFAPGLTAIIGPNGSGKSNLVDAMRWVLGEHNSRLLRANRMEEVIFNGTRRLKPLSRAEVSLTIDNSDAVLPLAYREVRLTRRLFRSGEAEYLLNQAPCRLKDIQQLLWDTGVGRQGFAIIAQGQVEDLLAATAEERRQLLEEVAGIVRYRHRRQEAEEKLAETKGHLLRLHDLMAELQTQLASLAHEVEVARRYRQLLEELQELEKQLAFWQLKNLARRREELAGRRAALEGELARLEEQSGCLEEAIEAGKRQQALLEEEREQARKAKQDLAAARHQIAVRLAGEGQRLTLLAEEQARLSREREECGRQREQVEEEMTRKEKERQQLAQERQRLETEHRAAREALAAAEAELKSAAQRRDQRQARLHDLWQAIVAAQNRLRALEGEWQAARARGQRLVTEEQRLTEEKATLSAALSEAEGRIKAKRAALEALEADLASFRERMAASRRQLAALEEAVERLRQTWQQEKNRLAVLKEWQQGFEGYQQAVRAVLRARGKLWADGSGIIGVVAELLQVPAELEAAIEAALGGALQYIVTQTENDAQRAIAYLKASGAGRATFLPLDAIRPRRLPVDRVVLTWNGVVGLAAELVQTSPACAPLLPHLLGDLLVVTRLEVALAIARRLGYRVRLVTLEGEVLQPGGALSGGSSRGRSGGLLARLREIGELTARVEAVGKELGTEQEAALALQAELAGYAEEERRLQERVWALRSALAAEEEQWQELGRRQRATVEHLAVVAHELTQWEQEFQALTAVRGEGESQLADLQQKLRDLTEAAQDPEDGYRHAEAKRAELVAALEKGREQLVLLERREEHLRGGLAGLKELSDRYRREEREKEARIQELAAELRALADTQQELEREMGRLEDAERKQQEQLAAVEQACAVLGTELREKEAALAALRAKKNALEKKHYQVQFEAAEEEMRWRAQLDRLQQLGWREEEGLPPLSIAEPELRERLALKEREKEELGAVDLGVLAEYQRLEERYAYFAQQAQDLEAARGSLNRVVTEVERLMEERLRAALEAVNGELLRVFPALFGGGKAWLASAGEGRLLDGGLELLVQLPGKRVPHLALLSGGERALTAIAVLFALVKVKGSPFCVLDEIDAALDEANVVRFARFLRDLAATKQFIVVSHRASTVEQADNVYGVTMEEEGVSRLVSLRLPRAKEHQPSRDNVGERERGSSLVVTGTVKAGAAEDEKQLHRASG